MPQFGQENGRLQDHHKTVLTYGSNIGTPQPTQMLRSERFQIKNFKTHYGTVKFYPQVDAEKAPNETSIIREKYLKFCRK